MSITNLAMQQLNKMGLCYTKTILAMKVLWLVMMLSNDVLSFNLRSQSSVSRHTGRISSNKEKIHHGTCCIDSYTTTARILLCMSRNNDNMENSVNDITTSIDSWDGAFFSRAMIGVPFFSIVFPIFLELALNFQDGSKEQFTVASFLFGYNRVYIYVMSATVVALAALRGSQDDARLGQRVVDLTEEMLYNPPLDQESKIERKQILQEKKEDQAKGEQSEIDDSPAMISSLRDGLGDTLDDVSTEKQAITLPLLVSGLLASSVFYLQVINSESTISASDEASIRSLLSAFTPYIPLISKIWTSLLLVVFSRCEVRRLVYELDPPFLKSANNKEWVPWVIAVLITGAAYYGGAFWPAQNFLNMALAILVARAIQINDFPAIVAALTLLTFYDAASVFLIKPAIAAEISSTTTNTVAAASSSASAMGAVAMNKLTSDVFQPGLFITKIGNRLGGALGLGDAVFPSLLATFSIRYDKYYRQKKLMQPIKEGNASTSSDSNNNIDEPFSLFAASMVGYLAGCAACQVVPNLSTSGIPALVLITPFMLASVVAVASLRGELDDVWGFNEGDSKEGAEP